MTPPRKNVARAFIVAVALVLGGCTKTSADSQSTTEAAPSDEDGRAQHSFHDDEAHGEHGNGSGHAHAEGSDLDRPPAELFAATCEHGIKTHQCDECRYEVGVAKAPSALFEQGLLAKAKAEKRPMMSELKLTGEVRFDERKVAHVSTQVDGVIQRVEVTLGDAVKRGQPLLRVSSVTVGEAQAALVAAESVYKLARSDFERVESLRQENIASERELLEARQQLKVAEIRAEAERAKLRMLGAGSQGGIVLRAPVDGVVLDMHAVSGEVARAETPVVTVGDSSSVWVWADLYERDIAAVARAREKGPLAAGIEVKGYPGQEFQGQVDLLSPAMSETSRTVKLRIVVPNPKGELLAGMFAQVTVYVPERELVLAVPREAVVEDEGRSFVFVHREGDYYLRRPVEAGREFAGYVTIAAGLTEGDPLVTKGAFLLKSDVLRSKMGAGCAD